MAITPQQINNANAVQGAAAQDRNQTVRLVAGPGTGKSFVIEGRVHWLLSTQGIAPENIIAISFTRAASKDLKERIVGFCLRNNQPNVTDVRVSTLHSLALYILRRTGNLAMYASDPVIMDDWELSNVFDAEFGNINRINGTRCKEIRFDHEAFWSTGVWSPPNMPVITVPITGQERSSFQGFYSVRTQAYSCVLPGEVVRTCVRQIQAGLIDPIAVLGVEHLIVDEVQDLNPCDFDFINALIARGVNVFISGDDDQSVYSFRYAFPEGIQNFTVNYPQTGDHVLNDCFRCTSNILAAANSVIQNHPAPNRIPKNLTSVYSASNPLNFGFVQANSFNTPVLEANYIANSCIALIRSGLSPKDIMILTSNKRMQLPAILTALDNVGLRYDTNQKDELKESKLGRFVLSLLKIKANQDDYLAHRVLCGTPDGIGIATLTSITTKTINNNINYKDLFYNPLPAGVFSGRETSAINKAISNINTIQNWDLAETLSQRSADIHSIVANNFGQDDVAIWDAFVNLMPDNISLEELKDYLQTDSQEIKENIIKDAISRSDDADAEEIELLDKIKIMSFHSCKGLSAKIVFIPGLEETVFPNSASIRIPGLIQESARLFYVAITRAKAACIISYTTNRMVFGTRTRMSPSRFCASTGLVFRNQPNNQLSNTDIQTINTSIANL